jgi:hypothetical protein
MRASLCVWQIDNDGIPNALTLGDFLADEETKEQLRDRSIIKTLTFKAAKDGPNIPKAEAIATAPARRARTDRMCVRPKPRFAHT